jgi:hypothetical protein
MNINHQSLRPCAHNALYADTCKLCHPAKVDVLAKWMAYAKERAKS